MCSHSRICDQIFRKRNSFCFIIVYPVKAFSDFTVSSGFKMRSLILIFLKFCFCGVLFAWSDLSSAAWWSGSITGSGLSVILMGGFLNPLWNEMCFKERSRFPTLKTNHPADFLPWFSSVISLMCPATLLQNKYSEIRRERGEKGGKNRPPSELLIWNLKHFIDTRKTQA